eukprot:TRINITY_DN7123_c0_g1_i1.p1 TRINITY_DN7123_c0_g1~~TRINITY_DN7123_c0_g1_i1.p1  ORF type:complete len:363 (-),score=27.70 TRINITY_DN7123_c0_g1_i1:51-1139(-)
MLGFLKRLPRMALKRPATLDESKQFFSDCQRRKATYQDIVSRYLPEFQPPPPPPTVKPDIKSLTLEEKAQLYVSHSLTSLHERIEETEDTGICVQCWLLTRCCFCHLLDKLPIKHRFFLVMHPQEFLRTSNTGKLLLATTQSECLVMPVPQHIDRLRQIVAEAPTRTLALFPSAESISASEFLDRLRQAEGLPASPASMSETAADQSEEQKFPAQDIPSLNIILFDGTWNQARKLPDYLPPGVPHVRIEPRQASLFDPLRKQSQPDRISTIESAVVLLQELGEDQSSCQKLLDYLKLHVDAHRIQNRSPQIYNSFDPHTEYLMKLDNLPGTMPQPRPKRHQYQRRRYQNPGQNSAEQANNDG